MELDNEFLAITSSPRYFVHLLLRTEKNFAAPSLTFLFIFNHYSLFSQLLIKCANIIGCFIDLHASVGDHSKLKVDFLQNERIDVSAVDGTCMFNKIEVHFLFSLLFLLLLELFHHNR